MLSSFSTTFLDQLIIRCFTPLPTALTNSPDSDSLESSDSNSETPDLPDYGTPDSVDPSDSDLLESSESESETPHSHDSGSPDLCDSFGFGSLLN